MIEAGVAVLRAEWFVAARCHDETCKTWHAVIVLDARDHPAVRDLDRVRRDGPLAVHGRWSRVDAATLRLDVDVSSPVRCAFAVTVPLEGAPRALLGAAAEAQELWLFDLREGPAAVLLWMEQPFPDLVALLAEDARAR